jgi:hypothetical protein
MITPRVTASQVFGRPASVLPFEHGLILRPIIRDLLQKFFPADDALFDEDL